MSKKRKVIDVYGIVQGVGFRPFVYNLAIKNSLTGYVNNNSNGVIIDIQGEEDNLKAFIVELSKNPPLLSKIKKVKITEKKVNQKYKALITISYQIPLIELVFLYMIGFLHL